MRSLISFLLVLAQLVAGSQPYRCLMYLSGCASPYGLSSGIS